MKLQCTCTTSPQLAGIYLVSIWLQEQGISHKDSIITAIACKKRVQIECKPYYIVSYTSINSMHFWLANQGLA